MTKAEILAVTVLALLLAALGYYSFAGVPFSSRARIEGFDRLTARVAEAAASGRIAAGLATPVCQAGTPAHIAELAHDFLRAKAVLECSSDLQPATALAKPVAVVDFDRQQIDELDGTLGESLRAPTLDAAATIAFIHCTKKKTGSYGFFRDAYAQECNILFVAARDAAGMRILGFSFFRAAPPEKVDTRFSLFGDVLGDRPDFDMRYYIVSRFTGAAEPANPSATR